MAISELHDGSEIDLSSPQPNQVATLDDTLPWPLHEQSSSVQHGLDIPVEPDGFAGYLYPTLTDNERLRLTALWTHSRGMMEDTSLIQKLQSKLDLLKTLVDWEFAICGLLDNDLYHRVVTIGLPLADLPRRESTCSHTVQAPGVLYLPDMVKDWRFANSPHVCQGGLRSYAGTRLQYHVDGEDVALGSLCIASNTPGKLLDETQRGVMIKIAQMITTDIVDGARQRRADQQRLYDLHLQSLATEQKVLEYAAEMFQGAHVELTMTPPSQAHLWQDQVQIDELIRTMNHRALVAETPIRTMVVPVEHDFIVVSTCIVSQLFDDVDSHFLQACASSIANIRQKRHLQEALLAKTEFMRGITHQLRTPIHGILGSVDLLAGDIASSADLAMIKDSGLELMSTINNVIKFNQWISGPRQPVPVDLDLLETNILDDISWLPDAQLDRVSIIFDNRLSGMGVTADLSYIRDCLELIVLNAIQNTTEGSVIISMSADDQYRTIVFDIKDTGCGIVADDQQRIFNAYEKCSVHSQGPGLGLTLATKMADACSGTVSLVSSEPGKGSHFRAAFGDVSFFCASAPSHTTSPHRFCQQQSLPFDTLAQQFVWYLKANQWVEVGEEDAEIMVVTPESSLTTNSTPLAVSLVSVATKSSQAAIDKPSKLCFTGPFTSAKLRQILHLIHSAIEEKPVNPFEFVEQSVPAAAATTPTTNTTTATIFKPTCLLVDDNDINLRILCHFCDKYGYPYLTARDGLEAFAQFKAATPRIDLVLLDLQMPVRDGIQACEDIRAYEKESKSQHTQVFMVTGQDNLADRQRATAAGADKFFVKPLALRNLHRSIVETFDAR